MSEANVCPHCEGRLVAGAKVCLHCGAEVTPAKTESTESEGALARFMLSAIVFIAVLGALAVVAVNVISDKLGEGIPEPQTFEEEAPTDKVCVPAGAEAQIAKLTGEGRREVGGQPGQRCFVTPKP